MDGEQQPQLDPREPLNQTELINRLDHAVFGIDTESGLLFTMRGIEHKLSALILAIVMASLSLIVALLAATAAIVLGH